MSRLPTSLAFAIEPGFISTAVRGNIIQDITDGQPVYIQKKDAATQLRETFAKTIAERGADFSSLKLGDIREVDRSDEANGDEHALTRQDRDITYDELSELRQEVLTKLDIAGGELSQALDIVNVLVSAGSTSDGPSHPILPKGAISVTAISPEAEKISSRSLSDQIVIGTKDGSLKDASDILSGAADHIETFVGRAEIHWGQAISLRHSNWPLVPKLPLSTQSRKHGYLGGARDFLISYGLENSPIRFRRQATASLREVAEGLEDAHALDFTLKQRRRLKISIISKEHQQSYSNIIGLAQDTQDVLLENRVSAAQREIIEQEIFAELIREASTFPSAAATVSETRITMMAAADIEATFEMIRVDEPENLNEPKSEDDAGGPNRLICALISDALVLLLIRYHRHHHLQSHRKSQQINKPSAPFSPSSILRPPSILAPIISLLQYYSFCLSLKSSFDALQAGLTEAGISCNVLFTPVGNDPSGIIKSLSSYPEYSQIPSDSSLSWIGVDVSGEAVLWIDDRHPLRFTFSSPTSLTAHLPRSDLNLLDITLLQDLLRAEVGLRIIASLKDDAERRIGGRWAVESLESECIAEWGEQISMRARVRFDDNFRLNCRVHIRTPADDGSVRTRTELFGLPVSTYEGRSTLKSWFKGLCRSLKVT